MIDLSSYPELLVTCISGRPQVIQNALRWSAISKDFYELINSSGFFLALTGFKSSQECFKDRYFEWRKACVTSMENCPDVLYSPHVARSGRYLALNNGSSSSVSVFTADGETFLTEYDFTGIIFQLSLEDSMLYVVEKGDAKCHLLGFDLLNLSKKAVLYIPLDRYVHGPLCFGKSDILYVVNSFGTSQPYSINRTSSFNFGAVGEVTKGLLQYFPNGSDFIELSRNTSVIDLSDVIIKDETFIRTKIACDIAENIPMNVKMWFKNACFSKDRLFIAYNVPDVGLKIYAYDLQIKEMYEVLTLPIMEENPDFRSRFLCVDETIYYLRMELLDGKPQGHLASMQFRDLKCSNYVI